LVVAGVTGRLGGAFLRRAVARECPIVGGIRSPRATAPRGTSTSVADLSALGPQALPELLRRADVYVSATTASAERENLPVVAELGIPAVVATTGLSSPSSDWLQTIARRIPLVVDANFSIGARLLRRAVAALGPLPAGFDISIVETHRREKLDHPSATARVLADELREAYPQGWEEAGGQRRPGVVEVSSLRGGETPGIHMVQVMGPLELLRFEHIAYGRDAFADGMLASAFWLYRLRDELAPGLYSLDDVLGGP
jgi:4-hydroxy-tetrahydrodipicolinate reductase